MQPSRPATRPARRTAGLVTLGVAATAAWFVAVALRPQVVIPSLFLATFAITWIITRTAEPRETPPRDPPGFRFSIWQFMATSALLAVIFASLKSDPARGGGRGPLPGGPLEAIIKAYLILGLVVVALGCGLYLLRVVRGIFRLLLKAWLEE